MKKVFTLILLFLLCIKAEGRDIILSSDIDNNGILVIPTYTEITIPQGQTVTVSGISWERTGDGSKGMLNVVGTLTIDNNGSDVTITDPKITIDGELIVQNQSITFNRTGAEEWFHNYGTIKAINNGDDQLNIRWTGDWDCGNEYYAGRLDLSNGQIKTDGFDIYIHANNGVLGLGEIEASSGNLDIDRNGGSGTTTAESLVVDGTINLKNAAMNINVYDELYTDNLNISGTYNSVTITCKPSAEIFVKDFNGSNSSKQLKFKADNGGVISLCKNPNQKQSDWGWGKLVTLSEGSVFNYIVEEYPTWTEKCNWCQNGDGEWGNWDVTKGGNPYEEGDVELPNGINYTDDLNQVFGKDKKDYSWEDFRHDWREWYHHRRDERYAYIIGAYANASECQSVYNEKKMNLLPITLTSFTYDETTNMFYWTTASEVNNEYFIVEYSKNGTDWTECTNKIYSKSSTGYTYSINPITTINQSVFSYFRLKQVDFNGEFSLSDIIVYSIDADSQCSNNNIEDIIYIEGLFYRYVEGKLIFCESDN